MMMRVSSVRSVTVSCAGGGVASGCNNTTQRILKSCVCVLTSVCSVASDAETISEDPRKGGGGGGDEKAQLSSICQGV